MASIDAAANITGSDDSVSGTIALSGQPRLRIGSILGGTLLTGIFLAMSAAAFPLAAVYGFVWFAQHYSL